MHLKGKISFHVYKSLHELKIFKQKEGVPIGYEAYYQTNKHLKN